jgi:hypothetical protein
MTVEKSLPELKGTDFESAVGEAMDASLFRTRVAVLWVAVALAVSGSLLLYLFMPGALEELLAGEMEGETLDDAIGIFMATMVIIPIVMAAVTLLVGDRANRSVNLLAGLAFGLFGVYAVVRETSADGFNLHVLMVAVAAALALLIAALGFVGLRESTEHHSFRT